MNGQAKIVTFYSYKGGVGRSMALANVAWLLSTKYGRKVLVVDWDLEAPGLHRFFGIDPKDIKAGLIDLFEEYKALLKKKTEGSLPAKLVEIKKCFVDIPLTDSLNGGSLSLIAAGKQDPGYVKLVNAFDWNEFYETWHGYGFFEYLKTELKDSAEIVLLDSRTGVTDIGGICTLQLPDIVILLFALNEQNISGTEFIAESILKKVPELQGSKSPTLIIRPARVEKFLERDQKNEWEDEASKRLRKYLPAEAQDDPLKFIKQNSIPYVGAYGFGERPLASAKVELHADEPALSFDALAVSILKASGFWSEKYLEQSPKAPYFSAQAARRMFTYLLGITIVLAAFIVGLWPSFDENGEWINSISLVGLRFPLYPVVRLFLVSIFAGGIGSCLASANRLLSLVVARQVSKQSLRYFFAQPLMGIGTGSTFFLLIIGLTRGHPSQANIYVVIAVSALIGMFSDRLGGRLTEVARVLFQPTKKYRS